MIELLVVLLIVGVILAIAIPSFLSQTAKANDAGAKTLAAAAEHAAEAIGTDNNGEFQLVVPAEIHSYEAAIATSQAAAHGGAWLSAAEPRYSNRGYVVTVTSTGTLTEYSIERNEVGEIIRSCKAGSADPKACAGW
jgi:type IV pilus assembly protein PilA